MTTTQPAPGGGGSDQRCWCCDGSYPQNQLIHLDARSEVAVCRRCARYLHRRARARMDELHPSLRGRSRDVIRAARSQVTGRGWHQRPVVGRVLRWIDKLLP